MRLKEDLHKLRKLLVEKGPLTWGELKEETKWSPSVLKNRIDLLDERGELSATAGKRKGRRTTIYKSSEEENTRAEIRRYEAIKFIESIEDPTYFRETSMSDKLSATVFVPSIEGPLQKAWQINVDFMTKAWLKGWVREAEQKLKWLLKTKPGLKIAIVLTAES